MNFGNLLYIQPDNVKRNIRNIETTENKLANAKIAVIFSNTCLNENLLPRFSNICIYLIALMQRFTKTIGSAVDPNHAMPALLNSS